ncbi:MlaD family protein [Riemerella columbipharyngis]|uniref:Phospholipid/cholesterol/gamma-HCH transport system substrate-binding protein n=1 Tax=Riemerella columbipharyngis TaxID=1071918 RepID=A0A1G6Y8B5_9FLAO|nr:MlaD family protein [Riemerella columbipharyngis]SDD85957.1 phospholipid/cholesterol/gamma-HCH transport system substrate-binding protein [Riemerella columbipharyngis]
MKYSKELKAGLITLLAIVGFGVLYQFMKGKSIFTTDDVYYIKYDNVQGLAVSDAVSINGLKVGQVDKIIPITNKDGRITFVAKILVDKEFKFSKNSIAQIFEPGLMSGKEIKINLVYDNTEAKSGDTLSGNYQVSTINSLSSQVKPVKDQLTSVLAKLDSTLASTNKIVDEQNRQEIRLLLSNLNKTVESYRQTSVNANNLLTKNEPKIETMLDNANQATMSAKEALDKYGKVAESVDVQKLNQTIDNLNQTSSKLNQIISQVNSGEGSLGKLTKDDQLYNNLNKTSENLNSLVKDIKENPKRYLNISVFGK